MITSSLSNFYSRLGAVLVSVLVGLGCTTAVAAESGFTFQTTSVWQSGFCAEMRVPNSTATTLSGWTVTFTLAPGMAISSLWQGRWSAQGSLQTVRDDGWNSTLPPGSPAVFGFCGTLSGTLSPPSNCTLNGQACGSTSPPADTQAPSPVSGLSLASRTAVSVDLTWQASTDDVGVTGYEVFLNGGATPVATPTTAAVSISGLQPATSYSFTVKARDAAGNRSAASAALSVSTAAPLSYFKVTSLWSGGYCAEMNVPNMTSAPLSGWTVTFELTPGMTITSLWQGRWSAQGALQTVQDAIWNGTLPPGAKASFGFCGALSGTLGQPLRCKLNGQPCGEVPPPDTQAPSQVTGLSLLGKTAFTVDLSWQASTDDVGVIGYEVFLGTGTTPVATLSGTAASITGLSPSTAYSFTVKARDAAGNRSTASAPLSVTTSSSNATRKIVGYFPRWGVYGRAFYARNLETSGAASKLTHLHYAFGNVVDGKCGILPSPLGDPWADYQMGFSAATSVDGLADTWDQPLKGNFNQLKKLKARHPQLKVLISLGGWDGSAGFSDAVSTPEKRQAFVQSCVDLYIRGNVPGLPAGALAGVFDGIDIDWEFPGGGGLAPGRPEDTVNLTAALAEFRRQLDLVRPGLQLSIATPSAPSVFARFQLGLVHPYLDYIGIMTYDMHGSWDATTNFHAALYNQAANPAKSLHDSTNEAVLGHLAAGVPASKLLVGVPFYGRGWKGTQAGPAGDGLYQLTAGAARGNWDDPGTAPSGMFDYYYIQSTLEPAGVKRRHPEAQVPYLYNTSTGLWVSYDDPTSLGVKGDYINSRGLGGAMIWELSGDDAQASLVTALRNKLNPQ